MEHSDASDGDEATNPFIDEAEPLLEARPRRRRSKTIIVAAGALVVSAAALATRSRTTNLEAENNRLPVPLDLANCANFDDDAAMRDGCVSMDADVFCGAWDGALSSSADLFASMLETDRASLFPILANAREVCGATVLYEADSRAELDAQRAAVRALARDAGCGGARVGGEAAGRAGYELTFAIAYLRDFALELAIAAESFETTVAWPALRACVARVRAAVTAAHAAARLPGVPLVSARVTQLYAEGACVYFYVATATHGLSAAAAGRAHRALETAARAAAVRAGGTVSHHHGVGKLRASLLRASSTPTICLDIVRGMAYLHALEPAVLHRNLKSQNLLIDQGGRVKVRVHCTITTCRAPLRLPAAVASAARDRSTRAL